MSKTRLYGIAGLILLIFNIFLMSFIYVGQSHHRRQEGPRDIIIERLHFDNEQVAAYDKLINIHKENISDQESEILATKKMLYETLSTSIDTNTVYDLEANIGLLQKAIERINYKHFQDIKNLCRANQKEDFNALTKDLSMLFSRKGPAPSKK